MKKEDFESSLMLNYGANIRYLCELQCFYVFFNSIKIKDRCFGALK